MPCRLVFAVVLALLGPGCGEPDRLRDYLPPEAGFGDHEDPLMGPIDEDLRSPTDVDHSIARGKLSDLADKIQAWQGDKGSLPDSLDVLTAAGDMEGGSAIIPDGIWRVPVDPWGNPYEYSRLDEGGFSLRSRGPDGIRDTVDDLVEVVPMSAEGSPEDK